MSVYQVRERNERRIRWDRRFLDLAKHIAEWSKDPSTKVGAVIVRPDLTLASVGFNGFPRGVNDTRELYLDRERKYERVVHAEANAILTAGKDAQGATLYVTPLFSCNECAKLVIQAGICRVVSPKPDSDRWSSAYDVSQEMYAEAGVEVTFYE